MQCTAVTVEPRDSRVRRTCLTEGTGHPQPCNPLISARLWRLTPASPDWAAATPAGPASRGHWLLPLPIPGRTFHFCHPASACLGCWSSEGRAPYLRSQPLPPNSFSTWKPVGVFEKEKFRENTLLFSSLPWLLIALKIKPSSLLCPAGSFWPGSCHFASLSPGLLSGPPVQPCLRTFAYTVPSNCGPAPPHLCPHSVQAQLLTFRSQLNLPDS